MHTARNDNRLNFVNAARHYFCFRIRSAESRPQSKWKVIFEIFEKLSRVLLFINLVSYQGESPTSKLNKIPLLSASETSNSKKPEPVRREKQAAADGGILSADAQHSPGSGEDPQDQIQRQL